MPTKLPIISSTGRNPELSNIKMPYVTTAVTTIPARRGIWNSKESPMAPPRNSARSVAMAATSLIAPHRPDNRLRKLLAAHLRQVPPRNNAELGGESLEQHRDQIG